MVPRRYLLISITFFTVPDATRGKQKTHSATVIPGNTVELEPDAYVPI